MLIEFRHQSNFMDVTKTRVLKYTFASLLVQQFGNINTKYKQSNF